jgi:predicted transcriptional regulator
LDHRKRRDATEIRYEVLMASISGKRKTRIMYESGLNLKQLNLYLGELTAHGALEFRPLERMYFTTDKGRAFVSAFGRYRDTVNTLDKAEAALTQFFSPEMSQPLAAPGDRIPNHARTQRYHY